MSKQTVEDLAVSAISGVDIVEKTLSSGSIFGYSTVYPPSRTDQLHALSVSDMVRNQVGEIIQPVVQEYDFKDGKDNPYLEAKSMYEVDWADPAEVYESSKRLNAEFTKSIVTISHDKNKKDVSLTQPEKGELSSESDS